MTTCFIGMTGVALIGMTPCDKLAKRVRRVMSSLTELMQERITTPVEFLAL